MKSIVEKREQVRNEEIIMTKKSYMAKIGRAYNQGQVNTLLMIGKTVPEIAKLLKLNESTVRSIHGMLKSKEEGI